MWAMMQKLRIRAGSVRPTAVGGEVTSDLAPLRTDAEGRYPCFAHYVRSHDLAPLRTDAERRYPCFAHYVRSHDLAPLRTDAEGRYLWLAHSVRSRVGSPARVSCAACSDLVLRALSM